MLFRSTLDTEVVAVPEVDTELTAPVEVTLDTEVVAVPEVDTELTAPVAKTPETETFALILSTSADIGAPDTATKPSIFPYLNGGPATQITIVFLMPLVTGVTLCRTNPGKPTTNPLHLSTV